MNILPKLGTKKLPSEFAIICQTKINLFGKNGGNLCFTRVYSRYCGLSWLVLCENGGNLCVTRVYSRYCGLSWLVLCENGGNLCVTRVYSRYCGLSKLIVWQSVKYVEHIFIGAS